MDEKLKEEKYDFYWQLFIRTLTAVFHIIWMICRGIFIEYENEFLDV